VIVPSSIRLPVRRARNALALRRLVLGQVPRWRAIRSSRPRRDGVAVSYGVERMPGPNAVVFGGHVKLLLLHRAFPNESRSFNLLYLGSSSMPLESDTLVRLARRRRAAFVWNQNGVAYAGWYGAGWRLVNAPRARLLHEADHVFYQSEFCKLGADRFYGERRGPWEVLHNPVDTRVFLPVRDRPSRPLTLLLGGNQYQRYRVDVAVDTLALLRSDGYDARMIVAGSLSFARDARDLVQARIDRLELGAAVRFIGEYTRADAPSVMQSADILLHTKYNDPCPTLVLEAMAAGLPVVYSASGGTPELVGEEAGIGIPAELDWEHDHPPAAADLAVAVQEVAARLDDRRVAARDRAKRFDAEEWVARHRQVFEELLGR